MSRSPSRTFATAISLALKLFTADVRGPSSRRQLPDGSMMDAGFYQFPEITGRSEQWSIACATWKMKGRATNCERTNKFVSLSRAPYVRRALKKKIHDDTRKYGPDASVCAIPRTLIFHAAVSRSAPFLDNCITLCSRNALAKYLRHVMCHESPTVECSCPDWSYMHVTINGVQ